MCCSDVCTALMLFLSAEMLVISIARSFCKTVKLSSCVSSMSLIRSSMAWERSGMENDIVTSISSDGGIGETIFNSLVYIVQVDFVDISEYPIDIFAISFVKFPPHIVEIVSLYGVNILIFEREFLNMNDCVVTGPNWTGSVHRFQLVVSTATKTSSHVVGFLCIFT